MRLIDADQLIKTYEKETGYKWNAKGILECPKCFINNAPTVEPCYQTTSCLDCKNYDKANYYCPRFCEVIRGIAKENQRPQGEWIHYLGCGVGKAVCSECGQVGETKKYCGNCGADMRGKEE